MIGEIDIYGVLVPPLLVWTAIAVVLRMPLLRLLERLRLYRFIWHRALFDLAVLVVLIGAVAAGMTFLSEHLT